MKHLAQNTGNFEWYTPPEIVDAARDVMGGIDLDPASCELANQTVRATRFFTIEDDGIMQQWHGRVWLNPPYARRVIEHWIDQLISEYRAGRTTEWMALVNNATDTKWAQRLLAHSSSVCFLRGRIRFDTPSGKRKPGALQGQLIAYKGGNKARFLRSFRAAGIVFERGE